MAKYMFATPQEVMQLCQVLLENEYSFLTIPSGFGDVVCGLCGAGLGELQGKWPSSVASIIAHYRSCHLVEALCKIRNSSP